MEKEINLINSKIVDTNDETTKTVDQENISGWGELDFSDDDNGGNIHSTSIESDKPTKDGWDEWWPKIRRLKCWLFRFHLRLYYQNWNLIYCTVIYVSITHYWNSYLWA